MATIQHSDVIKSVHDYNALAALISKHNDLCEYYGKKTGHYDTHASPEYYHKELGISLGKARQIMSYLKQQGVLFLSSQRPNNFTSADPSLGFTGFHKPHADTSSFFGVDKSKIRELMPIWKSLQQQDPLDGVLK